MAGLTANYHGTADVSQATGKVIIELKDFFFEPTVLHGAPGQQVTFTLQNTSENPHTFTTADMSADIEVQPGMIAEGRVTLPRSGNLSFFCRFHKEQGMAGGFNVSGPVGAPDPKASPTPTRPAESSEEPPHDEHRPGAGPSAGAPAPGTPEPGVRSPR